MNLDFPSEPFPWIRQLVLGHMPVGDPAALRRIADGWAEASKRLVSKRDKLRALADREAAAAFEGATGNAIREQLLRQQSPDLQSQIDFCDSMAEMMYENANSVELEIYSVWAAGITLIGWVLMDLAIGTPQKVPLDRIKAELTMKTARVDNMVRLGLRRGSFFARHPHFAIAVRGGLPGAALGGGGYAGAEYVQIVQGRGKPGRRTSMDWDRVWVAAAAGGVGGFVGGEVGRVVAPMAQRVGGRILAMVAAGGAGGVAGGVGGGLTAWSLTGGPLTTTYLAQMAITGLGSGMAGAVGSAARVARTGAPTRVPGGGDAAGRVPVERAASQQVLSWSGEGQAPRLHPSSVRDINAIPGELAGKLRSGPEHDAANSFVPDDSSLPRRPGVLREATPGELQAMADAESLRKLTGPNGADPVAPMKLAGPQHGSPDRPPSSSGSGGTSSGGTPAAAGRAKSWRAWDMVSEQIGNSGGAKAMRADGPVITAEPALSAGRPAIGQAHGTEIGLTSTHQGKAGPDAGVEAPIRPHDHPVVEATPTTESGTPVEHNVDKVVDGSRATVPEKGSPGTAELAHSTESTAPQHDSIHQDGPDNTATSADGVSAEGGTEVVPASKVDAGSRNCALEAAVQTKKVTGNDAIDPSQLGEPGSQGVAGDAYAKALGADWQAFPSTEAIAAHVKSTGDTVSAGLQFKNGAGAHAVVFSRNAHAELVLHERLGDTVRELSGGRVKQWKVDAQGNRIGGVVETSKVDAVGQYLRSVSPHVFSAHGIVFKASIEGAPQQPALPLAPGEAPKGSAPHDKLSGMAGLLEEAPLLDLDFDTFKAGFDRDLARLGIDTSVEAAKSPGSGHDSMPPPVSDPIAADSGTTHVPSSQPAHETAVPPAQPGTSTRVPQPDSPPQRPMSTAVQAYGTNRPTVQSNSVSPRPNATPASPGPATFPNSSISPGPSLSSSQTRDANAFAAQVNVPKPAPDIPSAPPPPAPDTAVHATHWQSVSATPPPLLGADIPVVRTDPHAPLPTSGSPIANSTGHPEATATSHGWPPVVTSGQLGADSDESFDVPEELPTVVPHPDLLSRHVEQSIEDGEAVQSLASPPDEEGSDPEEFPDPREHNVQGDPREHNVRTDPRDYNVWKDPREANVQKIPTRGYFKIPGVSYPLDDEVPANAIPIVPRPPALTPTTLPADSARFAPARQEGNDNTATPPSARPHEVTPLPRDSGAHSTHLDAVGEKPGTPILPGKYGRESDPDALGAPRRPAAPQLNQHSLEHDPRDNSVPAIGGVPHLQPAAPPERPVELARLVRRVQPTMGDDPAPKSKRGKYPKEEPPGWDGVRGRGGPLVAALSNAHGTNMFDLHTPHGDDPDSGTTNSATQPRQQATDPRPQQADHPGVVPSETGRTPADLGAGQPPVVVPPASPRAAALPAQAAAAQFKHEIIAAYQALEGVAESDPLVQAMVDTSIARLQRHVVALRPVQQAALVLRYRDRLPTGRAVDVLNKRIATGKRLNSLAVQAITAGALRRLARSIAAEHEVPGIGDALTSREIAILEQTAHGLLPFEIAENLRLSRRTATNTTRQIAEKLKTANRAGSVVEAVRRGDLDILDFPVANRQGSAGLSRDQAIVLTLTAKGLTDAAIAEITPMTESQVKNTLDDIGDIFGFRDRAALVAVAMRAGTLDVNGSAWTRFAAVQVGDRSLSGRELTVLGLIVQGETNAAIAEQLGLSRNTVDTYYKRLRRKLGVTERNELAEAAAGRGIDLTAMGETGSATKRSGAPANAVDADDKPATFDVSGSADAPAARKQVDSDSAVSVRGSIGVGIGAHADRSINQVIAADVFDSYGIEVLGLEKLAIETALSIRNAIVDEFTENPNIDVDIIFVGRRSDAAAFTFLVGGLQARPPMVLFINEKSFGDLDEFRRRREASALAGWLIEPTGDPVYDTIRHEIAHLRDRGTGRESISTPLKERAQAHGISLDSRGFPYMYEYFAQLRQAGELTPDSRFSRRRDYSDWLESSAFGFLYTHFVELRNAGALLSDARFDEWLNQLDGYSLHSRQDVAEQKADSERELDDALPKYPAADLRRREVFNPPEALAEGSNAFGDAAPADFTHPAYALQALLSGHTLAQVWRDAAGRNAVAAARAGDRGPIPAAAGFRPSIAPEGVAVSLVRAWRALSQEHQAAYKQWASKVLDSGRGDHQPYALDELAHLVDRQLAEMWRAGLDNEPADDSDLTPLFSLWGYSPTGQLAQWIQSVSDKARQRAELLAGVHDALTSADGQGELLGFAESVAPGAAPEPMDFAALRDRVVDAISDPNVDDHTRGRLWALLGRIDVVTPQFAVIDAELTRVREQAEELAIRDVAAARGGLSLGPHGQLVDGVRAEVFARPGGPTVLAGVLRNTLRQHGIPVVTRRVHVDRTGQILVQALPKTVRTSIARRQDRLWQLTTYVDELYRLRAAHQPGEESAGSPNQTWLPADSPPERWGDQSVWGARLAAAEREFARLSALLHRAFPTKPDPTRLTAGEELMQYELLARLEVVTDILRTIEVRAAAVAAGRQLDQLPGKWMGRWARLDGRRLTVISPFVDPEHFLASDTLDTLARYGIQVEYRHVQVDTHGRAWATLLRPPGYPRDTTGETVDRAVEHLIDVALEPLARLLDRHTVVDEPSDRISLSGVRAYRNSLVAERERVRLERDLWRDDRDRRGARLDSSPAETESATRTAHAAADAKAGHFERTFHRLDTEIARLDLLASQLAEADPSVGDTMASASQFVQSDLTIHEGAAQTLASQLWREIRDALTQHNATAASWSQTGAVSGTDPELTAALHDAERHAEAASSSARQSTGVVAPPSAVFFDARHTGAAFAPFRASSDSTPEQSNSPIGAELEHDSATFARLREVHNAAVRQLISSMVRDSSLTDMLTDETFSYAARRVDSIPMDAPARWFDAIAVARTRNYLQFIRLRNRLASEYGDVDGLSESDPDIRVIAAANRSQLREALQQPEPDQRRVLELRFHDNRGVEEVAAELDIPIREVGALAEAGLRAVARHLNPERDSVPQTGGPRIELSPDFASVRPDAAVQSGGDPGTGRMPLGSVDHEAVSATIVWHEPVISEDIRGDDPASVGGLVVSVGAQDRPNSLVLYAAEARGAEHPRLRKVVGSPWTVGIETDGFTANCLIWHRFYDDDRQQYALINYANMEADSPHADTIRGLIIAALLERLPDGVTEVREHFPSSSIVRELATPTRSEPAPVEIRSSDPAIADPLTRQDIEGAPTDRPDVDHLRSLRAAVAAERENTDVDPNDPVQAQLLDRALTLIDELLAARQRPDAPIPADRLRVLEQFADAVNAWWAGGGGVRDLVAANGQTLREVLTSAKRPRRAAAENRLRAARDMLGEVWAKMRLPHPDTPMTPEDTGLLRALDLHRLDTVFEIILADMVRSGEAVDAQDPPSGQLHAGTERYRVLQDMSALLDELRSAAERPGTVISRERLALLIEHFNATSDLLSATAAAERERQLTRGVENQRITDRPVGDPAAMSAGPPDVAEFVSPAAAADHAPAAPVVWPGADGQPDYTSAAQPEPSPRPAPDVITADPPGATGGPTVGGPPGGALNFVTEFDKGAALDLPVRKRHRQFGGGRGSAVVPVVGPLAFHHSPDEPIGLPAQLETGSDQALVDSADPVPEMGEPQPVPVEPHVSGTGAARDEPTAVSPTPSDGVPAPVVGTQSTEPSVTSAPLERGQLRKPVGRRIVDGPGWPGEVAAAEILGEDPTAVPLPVEQVPIDAIESDPDVAALIAELPSRPGAEYIAELPRAAPGELSGSAWRESPQRLAWELAWLAERGPRLGALAALTAAAVEAEVLLGFSNTSPGPLLNWQDRPRLPDETIRLWKFRSMPVAVPLRPSGHEITNLASVIGRVIRALSLDEYPQYYYLGLVGARPVLPPEIKLTEQSVRSPAVRRLWIPIPRDGLFTMHFPLSRLQVPQSQDFLRTRIASDIFLEEYGSRRGYQYLMNDVDEPYLYQQAVQLRDGYEFGASSAEDQVGRWFASVVVELLAAPPDSAPALLHEALRAQTRRGVRALSADGRMVQRFASVVDELLDGQYDFGRYLHSRKPPETEAFVKDVRDAVRQRHPRGDVAQVPFFMNLLEPSSAYAKIKITPWSGRSALGTDATDNRAQPGTPWTRRQPGT